MKILAGGLAFFVLAAIGVSLIGDGAQHAPTAIEGAELRATVIDSMNRIYADRGQSNYVYAVGNTLVYFAGGAASRAEWEAYAESAPNLVCAGLRDMIPAEGLALGGFTHIGLPSGFRCNVAGGPL